MQIFLDTANIEEIKKFAKKGIIDGVTTNPALIASAGGNFKETIESIVEIIDGPISIEVISTNTEEIIKEGLILSKIHPNIVVKIPAIWEGIEAVKELSKKGVKTNVTIVYKTNQALLAAKAGATYVSPFVGRLDATSTSGIDLIKEIVEIYKIHGYKTKVLAASMRNEIYVKMAALYGADVVTVPPSVLEQMMESELTIIGLNGFLKEWNKAFPNCDSLERILNK